MSRMVGKKELGESVLAALEDGYDYDESLQFVGIDENGKSSFTKEAEDAGNLFMSYCDSGMDPMEAYEEVFNN